ncbi:MAG: DNA starvation/stationary phase protection protein Dps [Gemmatimonadales bacterium]
MGTRTLGPGPAYDTRNDLPEAVRVQVIALLNQRLADAIDLDTQTKQAHWNVKGPNFSALHLLFDAIHESVEGYVDLLAERIVQMGGVAAGTARMAAAHSELSEYPAKISGGAEHVSALAAVLAQFGSRVRRGIAQTGTWGDPDSADICTEISRGVDKWLWMVEAHGQGRSRTVAPLLQSIEGSA